MLSSSIAAQPGGMAGETTPLLPEESQSSSPLLQDSENGSLTLPPPEPADNAAKSPFMAGVSVSRFWVIFGVLLAALFIANFDSSIMASSHPVVTSYFHSSNSASWLSTAFLLTSTTFQPLVGRLSDTVGRKPPYIVTMSIFTLGTLWCALAGSMASFIAARAVCGLGAGGMLTLGSIILSDLVPIE
jgi:Na+/melibiose symporter-like transporter